MEYTILIAEDDEDIIKLLKLYLESSGYHVLTAENGVDAYDLLEGNKIDLAVLDIMMPRMDGYELTQRIREKYNIPILILSAKNQDSDKILGLNLGADDYMTKPFNPLEIVARVQANLRRFYNLNPSNTLAGEPEFLSVGELVLDTQKLTLQKGGSDVVVTPTEYKILALLMKSPGRVYTKSQIYESINGEYFEADENTIMVHISKLREKIEDDSRKPKYIVNIRGLGYKIEDR